MKRFFDNLIFRLREMKESLEKVLLDQKKVEQYHHNLIKKK